MIHSCMQVSGAVCRDAGNSNRLGLAVGTNQPRTSRSCTSFRSADTAAKSCPRRAGVPVMHRCRAHQEIDHAGGAMLPALSEFVLGGFLDPRFGDVIVDMHPRSALKAFRCIKVT